MLNVQFDYTHIQEELKQNRRFCGWKLELNKDGKLTKVPYGVGSELFKGYRISNSDPDYWGYATYLQAVANYQKFGYRGVGYFLRKEDGITCVEGDNAIDANGVMHPQAEKIIRVFNSFTEISQSGEGFHIFVLGNLPPCIHKVKLDGWKLEAYDDVRFFALTGCIWNGYSRMRNAQPELDALCKKFLPVRPEKEKNYRKPAPCGWDENEILERIRKSKSVAKFFDLYDGGMGGYGSLSEGDYALAHHLAFWCKCDLNMMNSLFVKSGRYRPKCERLYSAASGLTYLQKILFDAVENTVETYSQQSQSKKLMHSFEDFVKGAAR